ncbi:hypothetical protein PR003_g17923 [Phytophthora rubi]|uniref:RxLR effector protein n=1 Tax=Phytophthora rubi TaxID=129364 RepID=A0A6A3KI58_9STRA|nr:hypothetical protein PR001_g17072 [Phytophthora rubi]KAE9319631.1 hypothetical protein PR003_g17923 [Phytophthora rubi]
MKISILVLVILSLILSLEFANRAFCSRDLRYLKAKLGSLNCKFGKIPFAKVWTLSTNIILRQVQRGRKGNLVHIRNMGSTAELDELVHEGLEDV